jgi:hypothetical protein
MVCAANIVLTFKRLAGAGPTDGGTYIEIEAA